MHVAILKLDQQGVRITKISFIEFSKFMLY